MYAVLQGTVRLTSDEACRAVPARNVGVCRALNRPEQPARLRTTPERLIAAFEGIYVGASGKEKAISQVSLGDMKDLSVRSHGGGRENTDLHVMRHYFNLTAHLTAFRRTQCTQNRTCIACR